MIDFAILSLAALISSTFAGKLPSDFKTCSLDDPNINECLRDAVQDAVPKLKAGNPQINARALDPLHISSARIKIGKGQGVLNYRDLNIHGFSQAEIETIELKATNSGWNFDFDVFVPEVIFRADYDISGRILVLPVVGNGKSTVTLTNVQMKLELVSETYEKKGTSYLNVKDSKVALAPEKVTYNFGNLLNNKALGDQINLFLNVNWPEVFLDFQPGYEALLETTFRDYANDIFDKVAVRDLFPQKSS